MFFRNFRLAASVALLVGGAAGASTAGEHPATAPATAPAPTVSEQMAGLQGMCADTAKARSQRQAAESLYERLGGHERILALTTDIVRRHRENEPIKHLLEGVDDAKLAGHVADFVAAGTGGDVVYKGRSLQASHADLHLTDADFLAAGGDIIAAMQAADYGQNEIDEIVCILVSLKDQVVFK